MTFELDMAFSFARFLLEIRAALVWRGKVISSIEQAITEIYVCIAKLKVPTYPPARWPSVFVALVMFSL
jgi:hypothetical protein